MQKILTTTLGQLSLLFVVIALLSACTTAQPEAPAAGGETGQEGGSVPITIRVGYLPVIIQAPLFVGIERGYFAEEGITFELETIRSGNDAVVQLAAGNFDIAMGGANAGLFNAAQRGVDFTIVAPMHSEAPPLATPLIISPDQADEIRSVADLEGKTVAVHAFGAAIEYWMAEALAQSGLTLDDVELRAVPFPSMPGALASGEIDAAVLTEPLVTINQGQGLVQVLADDYIDGFTPTYVYVNEQWKQDNPEVMGRFLRAYLRALQDLEGDYMNEEIAGIIEQYTEVPAPVVMQSTPARFSAAGRIPVEDLETLQEFYMERGQLEYDTLLDVSEFVDATMLEEAARELNALYAPAE